MARRSFGYPRYEEPQQQEVVGVPYISMYNPQDYQDYSKILEQGQQRYDVAQSAIAKYMEDYSNAPVSARNMSVLDEIVQNRLSGIDELVSKKYNGEYGNAANEIVQQLALARKPIMQAQQDYVNEMRAREEFNKSQPIQFIKNPNTGKAEATPMSFEQYYKLKPSFDSEGRFTPSNFGPIRGRGEGDKWAMENISNPIMQQITSGNLTQLKDNFGDMAEVISQRGMSDADVDKYIEANSSWIIPSFLQNSKWSKEEFSNPDGSINYDLAKDYLKDIVKLQTVKSTQKDYKNNPQEKPTKGKGFIGNTHKGLYAYTGKVSDEGNVKPSEFTSFVQKVLGLGEEGSIREFISNGGHNISPTDNIKIGNKTVPSVLQTQLDYWKNLSEHPKEITKEGDLPKGAVDFVNNFFGMDVFDKQSKLSKEQVKRIADEVYPKLQDEGTREYKNMMSQWETLKTDYKPIYDYIKKNGGSDLDFVDAAEFVEKEDKKIKYSLSTIKDTEENTYVGESVINKVPGDTKLKRVGSSKTSTKSSLTMKPETFSVNLYNGIIRMEDKGGNTYEIPKEALPDDINELMTQSQRMLKKATKYKEDKSPEVLKYAETIESEFNESNEQGYPVILYKFDPETLRNVMTKIYVENPNKPVYNKDGSFTDNVYTTPDNKIISVPYTSTDLSDYLMHKLSINFNPYSKKQ